MVNLSFTVRVIVDHPGPSIIGIGAFLLILNALLVSFRIPSSSIAFLQQAGWTIVIIGFIVIFASILILRRI